LWTTLIRTALTLNILTGTRADWCSLDCSSCSWR